MNQGEVLSRTWKLLWKHKVLYLLGLVSALVSSGIGIVNVIAMLNSMDKAEEWTNTLLNTIRNTPLTTWVLLGLGLLVFWAVVLYLTQAFKAAQLRGVWQVDTAEPQQLSFGQLWQEGQPYVLRMILLSLVFGGISLIGVLTIFIPFIYGMFSETYWLLCLTLPLMVVLLAATILLQVFTQLGGAAIVAENLGVVAAIRRAWDVAIHHKAAVALLMLFLYLINYGISMLIQAPTSLFTGLINGGIEMDYDIFPMLQGLMIIMMLITVLYIGLWLSFYNTAWLLAYNQLTRPVDPAPVDAEPPQIQG